MMELPFRFKSDRLELIEAELRLARMEVSVNWF
jgi:hypothetical protein